MRNIPLVSLLVVLLLSPACAEELRILAWNVESGTPRPDDPSEGSDPAAIADQLQLFSDYDLVGLSEVRPAAAKQFVDALTAGAHETFLSVSTATGMDDRLLLAWNSKRLQLLESYELHRFGDWLLNSQDDSGNWRHRSPLVGHFRDRETGVEFLAMVNHFARGDESVRTRQAIGLRTWAAEQKLPVAAFGDFNFDFDFHTQQGNQAFQQFIKDSQWRWLKPELVDSNWADADPRLPLDQRKDKYPDSILDFIFVAGPARDWDGKSWVIVREGDFPDNGETSDHRPVAASLTWPSVPKLTRDGYPAHWWAPVVANDIPTWEILPQSAMPGEVILSKRHELGLLSNFAATPFTYRGKRYASLEGFWQAMLYPEGPNDLRAKHPRLQWKFTREQVEQMTAFDAKAAGDLATENMQTMGIDWVTFEGKQFEYRPKEPGEHYRLIVEATNEKVRQNPNVREVLLATGDLVLKPDHRQEADAPAAWEYFEILTAIRSELQATK